MFHVLQSIVHRLRRQQKSEAVNPEIWKYLCDRRSNIRQRILANRMYYQERQKIFDLREGMVKVFSILAGSAVFAKTVPVEFTPWIGIAITAASAASLVFGFGKKSRDSEKRSAEWALIERDMELCGERAFEEEDLNKWAARCNEVEAGEPAPNRTLFERCNSRACEAMGSNTAKLHWWLKYRPIILVP